MRGSFAFRAGRFSATTPGPDDDVAAYYRVALTDGANVVVVKDCMPFDPVVKQTEIKTWWGRHQTLRYFGTMKCSFDVPEGSMYDAEATLYVKQPTTLKIKRMNVVFTQ